MQQRAPTLPSERLQGWFEAGESLSFRGHSIFYRRSADFAASQNPVLVLIHGFPTASFDWQALWPTLAERYRLLAPDLLGYGFSAKPLTHDYSIPEQADLIEHLLEAHGVGDWHCLAHDVGDTVAQELLAREIERRAADGSRRRLLSLALLNGGLFVETQRPRLMQKLLRSPLGPALARLLGRRRFGRSFSQVFAPGHQPSALELDEFWALIAHADGQLLAPRLLGYIDERVRHRERWVGALVASPLPLRFINGLLDPISGAHMVRRYRELVPAADVVELADIGHYPQCEAPDRVLAAFLDFHQHLATQQLRGGPDCARSGRAAG